MAVTIDGVGEINGVTLPTGDGAIAKTSDLALVHINTTSFTAVSSVSLNDIFTSDYDNYRIFMESTGAAVSEINIRFRTAGVDNTTANYNYSAPGNLTAAGNQSFGRINFNRVFLSNTLLDISNPVREIGTNVFGFLQYSEGNMGYLNVLFKATTSFDGITFYLGTSTFTGKIHIYGYKNGVSA